MKCCPANYYYLTIFSISVVLSVSGCTSGSLNSRQSPDSSPVTQEAYNKSLPDDVYPDSRNRLPIVNRDELDAEKKAIFDERISPNTITRAGIQGPSGIRLHGSGDLEKSLVDMRIQELARLVVSREMNQSFEWTLHEPVALKEGLEPEIIDVIRYRKSLDGVPEKEASIIQLGREIFQNKKVSSETFARVLKQVGKRDLVDLCDFMGNYVKTAILLHTFDAHLPYDRKPLLPIP
jgi:4-carboxymuconolactone decarboxylase